LRLRIVREGRSRKFVRAVEKVSFSAAHSRTMGQEVLYVTERAVFRLDGGRLELIEVAPGIDVREQVLGQMECEPVVREVKTMPERSFRCT
jgi:propionate CoA-transferase